MLEIHKSGLVKRQTLSDVELAAIEQLIATCNAYEGLRMRLSTEWLKKRTGDQTNDFLYYEDARLAGYLNIDSHGVLEKELTGMVHPDYRRRGIFSALLAAAREECDRRGVKKLILVCEDGSLSGKAFAQAVGAHHDFSEHEMVLGTFHEKPVVSPQLHVRKAGAEDLEAIALIHATSFGDDLQRSRSYTEICLRRPWCTFYLGLLGEEPVACLRLDDLEEEFGIYGFGVRPEYQGRGYGRQLLQDIIRMLRAGSTRGIMLDVETNNTNAVGLYLSCGFEIRTTYGYYDLSIA
ncbi:MAG TPA: GNAT family N-acetyltransferase [Ktedonobacteraceae bacterium]|nr:GNAT family N-acetyltransferase [Ktedonobacteraceae bacterium]